VIRSGFYAGPNTEWMPTACFADNANTTTVDPNGLLNFRLGYDKPGARWSGYVEGRNLLDKRYIAFVDVAGTTTIQRKSSTPAPDGRSAPAYGSSGEVESYEDQTPDCTGNSSDDGPIMPPAKRPSARRRQHLGPPGSIVEGRSRDAQPSDF
jgi:hypothetical protein